MGLKKSCFTIQYNTIQSFLIKHLIYIQMQCITSHQETAYKTRGPYYQLPITHITFPSGEFTNL